MSALSVSPPLALRQRPVSLRRRPGGAFSALMQLRLIQCGRPVGAEECLLQATLGDAWQRCRQNPASSAAWEDLLLHLLPCFERIASRALWQWGLREEADVDDVLQDICLKICQLVQSDACLPGEEGALRAYFQALGTNAARDWARRRLAGKRNHDATLPIENHLDVLEERLRDVPALERDVLLRQIEERLEGSERDRAVFWLYFRQGLTAAEIAALPALDLTVKGVESLIHRMVANLRERLK